jgi:hypothetical protein
VGKACFDRLGACDCVIVSGGRVVVQNVNTKPLGLGFAWESEKKVGEG